MTRPRKWNLPLTYAPKIEAVRNGKCMQTIRVTGKIPKKVGDVVSFHGYQNGRGTPWTWRTPYWEIIEVINIWIFHDGLLNQTVDDPNRPAPWLFKWEGEICDHLAELDYINPPTGEALRDVLIGMNGKIPLEGVEAQVIRWRV